MKKTLYAILSLPALLMSNALFAADAAPTPPPAPDAGFSQTLIMMAIALAFFYLILWRPEQKRRKEAETLRGSLKKGDRVTAMGIIGTVSRVQEHTVIVRMVDGAKIEFIKAAITDVVPGSEEDAKKADREDVKSKKVEFVDADDV